MLETVIGDDYLFEKARHSGIRFAVRFDDQMVCRCERRADLCRGAGDPYIHFHDDSGPGAFVLAVAGFAE
jgi:hypothetical protein